MTRKSQLLFLNTFILILLLSLITSSVDYRLFCVDRAPIEMRCDTAASSDAVAAAH